MLRAGARQEATDLRGPGRVEVRPHHSRTEAVRLAHECRVGHDDPLALQPHPIAAILRIPIDILDTDAVGKRTAQALPACELIEPLLEWMVGVAAVEIARRHT